MNQREGVSRSDKTPPDIIEPIKFRPPGAAPQLPRVNIPWAHVIVAVALMFGVWGAWYVVTARSVSIETLPADALVTVDELFAPVIGGHWMLRPGPRNFVVEAPGYQRFAGTIAINDEALQSHSVILKPLPGSLKVTVSPAVAATVTVDQSRTAEAPTTIADIEAGAREITVSAARYLPFSTVVEIEGRGIEQTLDVTLKPAWATVSFGSMPSGAAVGVDGQAVGVTPLDSELLQGDREITLTLEGYKPWRNSLNVVAGNAIALPPILLVKADGYLNVSTTPNGASVTIDKQYKGQSPLKIPVTPDVSHHVSVLKEGYAPAAQSTSAGSGHTEDLEFVLTPELAAVQLITSPADAELVIDGESRGNANQTLELPTHAHDFEIRKAGYISYKTTVTPRKGIRKRITVRLKTPVELAAGQTQGEASAGRAGTGLVKTSIGQELKLFHGGQIKMGSSRREPGRRANEALHDVKLVRPFYIGLKEVTNGEFRRFLANHTVAAIHGIDVNGDLHPVVNASWDSAALFCNWLSRQDSLPAFYQIKNSQVLGVNPAAIGYRLPTEAEWAWVARSAPNSTEPFQFPWAGKFPPRGRSGNYADQSAIHILGQVLADYTDGFPVTAPVGSFPASLRGIYDLGGNVSEWVNDYYTATPGQSGVEQDPLGPRSGDTHVVRGSSWANATETELRLAYRDSGKDGRDDVGFRIARYAQ